MKIKSALMKYNSIENHLTSRRTGTNRGGTLAHSPSARLNEQSNM